MSYVMDFDHISNKKSRVLYASFAAKGYRGWPSSGQWDIHRCFCFLEKRTKAISSTFRFFLILGTLCWIKQKCHFHPCLSFCAPQMLEAWSPSSQSFWDIRVSVWSCFLMWDLKSKMILLIFTALSQSWGEHFTAVDGLLRIHTFGSTKWLSATFCGSMAFCGLKSG